MKIIVFQGQSQYDVLRYMSRMITDGFKKLGHEILLFDMNVLNSNDYLQTVQSFKPDFTIGFNPVYFDYNGVPHYEYTNIPHFVHLEDSGYYHVNNRALKKPNHPLVYTLITEETFENSLKFMNVEHFKRLKHYGTISNVTSSGASDYKMFPVVFFGSYTSSDLIINDIKRYFSGKLKRELLYFCNELPNFMEEHSIFLPESIDKMFYDFYDFEKNVKPEQRIALMTKVFPFIDRYYRNLCREHVLKSFAEFNVDMYVFGKGYETFLSRYKHIRIMPPVNYQEYLEISAQSKITLNITPNFFSSPIRIFQGLLDETLVCSSFTYSIVEEIPELLDMVLFYTWTNLEETSKTIKHLLKNDEERISITKKAKKIAEDNFLPEHYTQQIIDTYNKVFKGDS